MNNRSLEIAFKLFDEDDQSEPGTYIQLNVEKFAELILKECAIHLYSRGVEGFGILEERNLMEHFGVK